MLSSRRASITFAPADRSVPQSPTPALVASVQLQALQDMGKDTVFAGTQGPPVFDAAPPDFENERAFVDWLLRRLGTCLDERAFHCFVNSEDHPWLRPLEAKTSGHEKKPDFWRAPRYAVRVVTRNDGVPTGAPRLGTTWLDSVFVIGAKKEPISETAIGEVIASLQILNGRTEQPAFGAVVCPTEVHLLTSNAGWLAQRVVAQWTQPGTLQLLRDFFSRQSRWEIAVQYFCTAAGVRPVRALGAGASARVVEVLDQQGDCWALKVVLKDASHLLTEHTRLCALVDGAGPKLARVLPERVSTLFNMLKCGELAASAYLLQPVGVPIARETAQLEAAWQALRTLHIHGVVHGDARLPNVIRVDRRSHRVRPDDEIQPPPPAAAATAAEVPQWARRESARPPAAPSPSSPNEIRWVDLHHCVPNFRVPVEAFPRLVAQDVCAFLAKSLRDVELHGDYLASLTDPRVAVPPMDQCLLERLPQVQ